MKSAATAGCPKTDIQNKKKNVAEMEWDLACRKTQLNNSHKNNNCEVPALNKGKLVEYIPKEVMINTMQMCGFE